QALEVRWPADQDPAVRLDREGDAVARVGLESNDTVASERRIDVAVLEQSKQDDAAPRRVAADQQAAVGRRRNRKDARDELGGVGHPAVAVARVDTPVSPEPTDPAVSRGDDDPPVREADDTDEKRRIGKRDDARVPKRRVKPTISTEGRNVI